MKKVLSSLLSVMMLVMLFAGCSSKPSSTDSATPTEAAKDNGTILPLRYYMPGAPTRQADQVNEAINQKLKDDGLNIDFRPQYIPWDQWVDKINIMLSSGEEFELMHIMEDFVPSSTYASRGALTPLDDLIDKYTPGMRKLFDDTIWKCAKVNGKVITVPALWRDNSGDGEGGISYCKTRFDKYGLTVPTTLDEMIDTLGKLQKLQKEETGKTSYVYEHTNARCPVALHRAYDSWPFYASQDGIFKVTQDATASLFYESEEFQKDCDFMHKLYTKGLINPDILNLPQDTMNTDKQNGDYLMGIMTGGSDVLDEQGNLKLDFEGFRLNASAPYLCNLPLLNSNAVPSTTKHPEVGLKFLNWMYSNKENQDLVLYGIQGKQWEPVGDNEYKRMKDTNGKNLYAFDAWMIEYVPLHRFDANRTTSELEDKDFISNIHADNTVLSPVIGFNFNSAPVSKELANMVAEYTTSILPIKLGVVPYEKNFDNAVKKMKAAGSDAVIAEYQKQLADYFASQKK